MSWCWIARVEERPATCIAAGAVTEGGRPAGVLAAWAQGRKPVRHALRCDARFVDPDGTPAWVSLVLPPAGVRLTFDDLAVQQARRDLLAGAWPRAMTALLRDASHFEGSMVAVSERDEARLSDDPFARLFGARVLRVDSGVIGSMPAPTGPAIERYGSDRPWPADRFAGPPAVRLGAAGQLRVRAEGT